MFALGQNRTSARSTVRATDGQSQVLAVEISKVRVRDVASQSMNLAAIPMRMLGANEMNDIRKCPLHGDMYLTETFDGTGKKVTILECPQCDHQQRVLTADDIERIGEKAAKAGAVIRGAGTKDIPQVSPTVLRS